MERRCKSQQQQIFELKQELTNSTAELKLRLAQSEGNTHSQNTHTRSLLQMQREQMFFFPPNLKRFPVRHTLTDRLEMEKRRSKQALDDMDSLRQKEVLSETVSRIRDI